MGQTHLHLSIEVTAPIDLVFARISDHETMTDWPGTGVCTLIRAGEPRNGLGAVREIKTNGLTVVEEVVSFDPPNGYDYTIIKGLPVDHLGRVRLEQVRRGQDDEAVQLTWDIRMSSRWPFLCGIVGRVLRKSLPLGLDYFKAETEKAAGT